MGALDAANAMESKVIHGQEFYMNYNQPNGDDKGNGKGGKGKGGKGGDPGEKPEGCMSIMVRNLKTSVDEDALWDFFGDATPSKVKVVMDRDTGDPRGFAFVDFDDDET